MRDLSLSPWGPYSKHYGGYSKVIGDAGGVSMVDFVPLIGYDRGKINVPDINYDTSYHMLEASPSLDYVKYRFDLLKEEYAEAEFFGFPDEGPDGACLCRLRFVNASNRGKTYVASLMSVMRPEEQVRFSPDRSERACWIGAEEYLTLEPADRETRWSSGDQYEGNNAVRQLHMGMDGMRPGAATASLLTGGIGLGNLPPGTPGESGYANRTFLFTPGTVVTLPVKTENGGARGMLRYFADPGLSLTLRAEGSSFTGEGLLEGDHAFSLPRYLDLGTIPAGTEKLTLTVQEGEGAGTPDRHAILDGLLLLPPDHSPDRAEEFFLPPITTPAWEFDRPKEGGLALTSPAGPDIYLYSPDERPRPPFPYSDATVSHVRHRELSGTRILRKISNDALYNWYHVNCDIPGDGENHFIGYNLGPLAVEAGEERTVWAVIGTDRESSRTLFEKREAAVQSVVNRYKKIKRDEPRGKYAYAMGLLRACTLSNVTYPVRIGRELVKTYTPGKRWGGLFTWDSGMHGIGLNAFDNPRAAEILKQYFPGTVDDPVPVVLHGTPLPLHIYLLDEIYGKTGDASLIETYWDRARLYWSYFAGLHPSSSYDKGHTGMLSSYSDGYNSQGIDDYPIQHFEGVSGLYGRVKTVSITSHVIRTGKVLLKLAGAARLERSGACGEIRGHIDYLADGLQRLSWDGESGYFNHVMAETGEQIKTPDGECFNQGLDGVSPLIAGICSDEQKGRLTSHVMTPGEMWTPAGITAVSQRASYFRYDGYWNGKVWMPHQWFLWKAMISQGSYHHARRIARTMLDVFSASAEETHNSYELFDCRNGMGQGAHQFGGLSAPLAAIYHAYHKRGSWSLGFDTGLSGLEADDEGLSGRMELFSADGGPIRGIFCTRGELLLTIDGVRADDRDGTAELELNRDRAVLEWHRV